MSILKYAALGAVLPLGLPLLLTLPAWYWAAVAAAISGHVAWLILSAE